MRDILRYSKGILFLLFLLYILPLFDMLISMFLLVFGRKKCDVFIDKVHLLISKLFRLIYRVFFGVKLFLNTHTKIPPNTSHLILSNHKGASDFFALFMLLKLPLRFIAKEELAYMMPIINFPTYTRAFKIQDYALINRKNTSDSLKKIRLFCRIHTQKHNNILLFPEGTRYKAVTTKAFYASAVKLILKTKNIPIVLVALSNGHKIDSFFNVTQNATLRAKVMGVYNIDNIATLQEDIEKFRKIIDDQLLLWEKEDEKEKRNKSKRL